MADKRHYRQFCGLASALDVIGERWTLLIVRELLLAPARFSEIQENLPGLGTNLLSERLRVLTEQGIIEALPVEGDGRGKQYRLTATGQHLHAPLLMLSRWGMNFLSEDDAETGAARSAWGFLAVQAMIHGRPAPSINESYEFRVDDEVFHIHVQDERATAHQGPANAPAIVVSTDARTFVRIGAELLSPFDAVATGRLTIEGDEGAIRRCSKFMGLTTPA
ncbi:winged helix-turn-helix transcriptional regulator [Actinomadura syzygii]|uniref:Transcriptional regulator n=1 Tax=Actinomadura syzygii TaxID=1427538 RepID=A0A5D0U9M7_9ACTN|nr:winged helix-turn-helix transcriptional regulator [Actinomadura syzygii]TYC14345.1 transcriptional regulator [Actinomadura syzygii]